jgi:hypothetical protein
MSKVFSWLERTIGCFLILLMAIPAARAEVTSLPSAPAPQLKFGSDPTSSRSALPQTVPAQSGTQAQQSSSPSPSTQADQQNTTSAPVGTAVAPAVRPEGTAASRPAGAAIAPGKQRRTHTIAIRVALLVGAGVAIGTVTAATLGSSSHPSH